MVSSPPSTSPTVRASVTNGRVELAWSAVSDATSYSIKRGTSAGVETVLTTGITGTSYADTVVANKTTYYYVVSAVNGLGEGPNYGCWSI